MMKSSEIPSYDNPLAILQQLVRYDTTNPPGNELACIQYIDGLLKKAGINTTIIAKSSKRPNLIARVKGQGSSRPLLIYGHVDVVTTENQQWTHPPFEGRIADGYLWGRGTLDMKSGVAMMLAALLKVKEEGASLPGDVIFVAVADEEAGGDYGARYLVEEHSELLAGIRYALGEFGGVNLSMAGKRVYPIMIGEKQICWMKATFRGLGGHASMPVRGQSVAKLGHALQKLDQRQLPVHITPSVRMMFEAIAKVMPGLAGMLISLLLIPGLTDLILKLLGSKGILFAPLLRNTVSPTILNASSKINVIPAATELEMDGRLLPGLKPELMLAEVKGLLGKDNEIEILRAEEGPSAPDMGMFDTLANIIRESDPDGAPIPFVNMAITDARWFSKIGIQTYGFTPLRLPDDFNILRFVHGSDERIPVDAMNFGVQTMFKALQRFH